MSGSVALLGKEFGVAPKMGLMPLLRFATFAKGGATTNDMEAMASMYSVLRSVIAEDDWDAFEAHATESRADMRDLMEAVKSAIGVMTARPMKSPSGSSSGLSSTEMSSEGDSSWLVYSGREPLTEVQPILMDPRVQELQPIGAAARRVAEF